MPCTTYSPPSNTLSIILPETGSHSSVSDSLPFGVYAANTDFVSGAVDQVKYTYKKLGGDILDLELTEGQVYAAYEEACLEYSYILNIHQGKNALGQALGDVTGTFDHDGSRKTGPDGVNLKYPHVKFAYANRVGFGALESVGMGGVNNVYSASFDLEQGVQDYDLQEAVLSSSYASLLTDTNKTKITVHQVFYKTPKATWRFFGYHGGIGVVGNLNTYGQWADDSTWQVIPVWQNKLQAMAYEDSIYTRISHFSYELKNNKIRIWPIPSVWIDEMWFKFSIKRDSWEEEDDRTNGVEGVNNLNSLPYDNLPYNNINAIGKQWIRRFALSVSKEMLGLTRSKLASIPIPGNEITLNGPALISEAKEEQEKLREELKETLDTLTYAELAKRDAEISEAARRTMDAYPMCIFVR